MILFDRKEDCCSCTACLGICPKKAISMQSDSEGFLYPVIDKNLCVDCGLCKKICPMCNEPAKNPIPDVYAFKYKSDEVRLKSSSGGAFTAVSDYVLEKKGYVFGAEYDENFCVSHAEAHSAAERDLMRGSKYVRSRLGDTFEKVKKCLEAGEYVLFSGTPCQVAGLYACIGREYERLITCDLICHGTPSPKLWKDYLEHLKNKTGKSIVSAAIRETSTKWGDHMTKVIFDDGSEFFSKEYIKLFTLNNALHPACYSCRFTSVQRVSDFTLSDFWGIENAAPELKDEKGVSMLFVNTKKAAEIFDEIKSNAEIKKVVIETAVQPQLYHPVRLPRTRKMFWRDYSNKGIAFVIDKYVTRMYGMRLKLFAANMLKKIKG